jgi:hypothetical protein
MVLSANAGDVGALIMEPFPELHGQNYYLVRVEILSCQKPTGAARGKEQRDEGG